MIEKSLFARWKQGMKQLTPKQLLEAKRISIVGQLLGLKVGAIALLVNGFAYWLLFLLFTYCLLVLELVSIQKQLWMLQKYV